MTTVTIVTSPDGEPMLAKISLSWQQVTERFAVRFEEQFQGKRKAHFDTLPETLRTVDGAKGKWMLLVMMDAIVYLLENDQPIETARRYFHQQRVLSESIMAEITIADAEIKANFGPMLPVEVFIHSLEPPWDTIHSFQQLHTNSTPTKAKQKYLAVLDLLINHHTITSLQSNMLMILSQTVTRVINCWASFEEALGPPPSSSPALSRRSMSTDSLSFDREDEMSSPVGCGMGPMLGALRPFYQAQRRRSHSPTQLQIHQPQQQSQQQQPTAQQQSSSLRITIPSAHRFQPPSMQFIMPPQPQPSNDDNLQTVEEVESMENVFGPRDHHYTDDHDDHMEIMNVDLFDVNMHQLDWDAFMTEVAHSDEFLPQHNHSASTDSFYLAGMRTATFSNSDNQLLVHHPGSSELHDESTEHDHNSDTEMEIHQQDDDQVSG
jgi:hypothetical protein